jgi:hypothetical protein
MATLKEQKEQKEKPEMTLEEMARSQLTVTEKLEADVAAIYKGLLYGFGKTTTISDIVEATTRSLNVIGGTLSSNLSKVDGSNKVTRNIIQDFKEFFKDIKTGKSGQDSTGDLFIKLGKEIENANNDVGDKLKKSLIEIYGRLGEQTYGEETLKRGLGSFLKGLGISSKDNNSNNETKPENKGFRNLNPPPVTPTNKGGGVPTPTPTKIKNTPTSTPKVTQKKEDETTKFENFSKNIETAFIGNLENIKKTNKGSDQGEINKVENNLKEDIKSLVKAFENKNDVNFSELFEKIKNENVNSPEYVKESLKKSYEEFYEKLNRSTSKTEVETKFLEQYEEFIKKNNGGIVSNTNNRTNKFIQGPDNKQQGNDSKSTLFNAYDALFFGTKNISGKPEENKDVANTSYKGTPVAIGSKDDKSKNIAQNINQNINQTVKIDYTFSPLEVKISGDNGKLDATKTQDLINTIVNNRLSTLIKDMAKQSKDKILVPIIAGDGTNVTNFNTSVKIG